MFWSAIRCFFLNYLFLDLLGLVQRTQSKTIMHYLKIYSRVALLISLTGMLSLSGDAEILEKNPSV